ncbi:hypothetical protein GTU73_14335 [Rathayibacter sp. VKM Ac-2804]|uniref:hypothetical protein n=1 Tax=Rathayibacter sp. VKM Ac-2804 TaxID=2609257 RepID=UPI00132EBF0C|nr:hypothetical protein [Rathayibacter sp. VKM Ac-2804]QHF25063.1 hypothetical protein GTU73_14335 [Rathayibacter sp. VKM Ac-2804]
MKLLALLAAHAARVAAQRRIETDVCSVGGSRYAPRGRHSISMLRLLRRLQLLRLRLLRRLQRLLDGLLSEPRPSMLVE